MLKKFLLSLIILSTLATEGIINFPGNIYNFLSCLNSDSRLNINIKEKVEPLTESEETGMNLSTFKLTANSIQKLADASEGKYLYKYIIIDSEDLQLNKYIPTSNIVISKTVSEKKKTMVLWRSDTSPPQVMSA